MLQKGEDVCDNLDADSRRAGQAVWSVMQIVWAAAIYRLSMTSSSQVVETTKRRKPARGGGESAASTATTTTAATATTTRRTRVQLSLYVLLILSAVDALSNFLGKLVDRVGGGGG